MAYNTKPIGVAYSDPEVSVINATDYASAGQFICNSSTGPVVQNITAGLYFLTTAITANSTTTSAPKGSIATTTNATGTGKLFVSDGSKWQYAVVA
jgi:hypothetical protein